MRNKFRSSRAPDAELPAGLGLPYARPLDQKRWGRLSIQRELGANKEPDGADRAILRVWFLAGDDWLYGLDRQRSKYSSEASERDRSHTKCVFKGALHLLPF